ncbi:hypothetical protein [Pseudarthrobacter enclensis]|uniref:Uncharacterized protein n=1 Tax=Pseudarthrobacter enclensis TaxID=993070 RepID=A0ABT9RSS2_9MICC|nr:hypothetical protein [Pseudarthrobacter enclensis]MDP9888292.1 hypothetical protein [Pseudarthrobacter enclensis]
MLSYRTLFSINPGSDADVVQGVLDRSFDWLRGKNLNVDLVAANQEVAVADHARVKWIAPDSADFAGTHRLILTEQSPMGEWISTITVWQLADGRPWFWMDVEGPEWAGTPRLVRSLIEQYSCSDRGVRLTKQPVVVRPQQVGELIQLLSRDGRRTLSFIAGSSAALPMPKWAEFVGNIVKQTTGQASAYVLDPVATTMFNQRVGMEFGVRPGMLRTYLPDLDINDPQDSARHRFLTSESIASQNVGRLRKTLSYKAREVAQMSLLDDSIRLIDRRLDELELRLTPRMMKEATPGVTLGDPSTVPMQSPSSEPDIVPESEGAASPSQMPDALGAEHSKSEDNLGGQATDASLGEQAEIYLALRSLVEEYAGGETSLGGVEALRGLLEAGVAAEALSTRLLAKIDQKSAALDEAAVEQAKLRHLIDDLELDAWDTWEQLEAQYARTRGAQDTELKLRGMLAKTGGDVDWTQLDEVAPPELSVPQNFNSLVESFDGFPYVVYTGDKDITAGLDDHDAVGRWCSMTWSILAALNDYARFKVEGADIAGVQAYLESPPPGAHTYHPGRHARDESETVKNNPSYSAPRTLPVPTKVSPSGEAFMGAHFRIAKHGLVSPRLHYLDATAIAGKIIVGYIGPHLPNAQTN